MASSPGPKRRRTSPEESSNWIDASNTTNIPNPRSSPPKQSRASYLSPTKASLSRHNPSLLPRPIGAGARQPAGKGKPTLQVGGPALIPSGERERYLVAGARAAAGAVAQTEAQTQQANKGAQDGANNPTTRTPVQIGGRDGGPVVSGGMSAAPRRRSRTPGQSSSPAKASQFTAGVPQSAPRTEAGDEHVDAQSQSKGSNLAEDPVSVSTVPEPDSSRMHEEDVESEPELPPTPVELGLEDPLDNRLPTGILSSPSKRVRRNRRLGEKLKSSPLKPTGDPSGATARVSQTTQRLDDRLQPELEDRVANDTNVHTLRNGKRRRTIEKRVVEEEDAALASKRQLKEQLLTQLKELQEEVARYEAEIYSETQPAPQAPIERAVEKRYPNQFLHVLIQPKDYTAPRPPPPKPKPPLSLTLSAFLPFSKPLPSRPRKPAPPPSGPIPSHQPLDLPDPLRYLKVFTPLDISSTTTLLPIPTSTSPLLQQHAITLTSPQKLLAANVRLIANTSTHTITSLALTSLSSWADPELGTYLRDLQLSPTSNKDISLLSHAISTYYTLASLRASCWATLSHEYPHLLSNFSPPQSTQYPTAPASHPSNVVAEEDAEEEVSGVSFTPSAPTTITPSRRTLLTHLPRSTLQFQTEDKTATLLISWRISFDWTGEAQSQVAATTSLPSIWTKTDTRASLTKIPDIFDRLAAEKGVLNASRAILGLLFQ
ncbi:MAG: hypothetical protein M1836_002183 [Candelina mexicana]|nr:MAG: hypothetical protein M1836_002183 [Candelina mexicana]